MQNNIRSQANYCTFDCSHFWCHFLASHKSASFYQRELGEVAECAKRPLFSIVLSRGLTIHVLIHVFCWGSRYPCSQHWIIEALCACRSHCPPSFFPLFLVLILSHLHIFVSPSVSFFEPNFKLCYLHCSISLLCFPPLLDYMCAHFSVTRIGIKAALIYCLTHYTTKILLEECTLQSWQLSHWLCCSKVVVSTVLTLCLHHCYIVSVAGQPW